jgi:hypothetical protein
VPVLMHGILANIFHRLTRVTRRSRSLDQSSPRREGETLASVTDDQRDDLLSTECGADAGTLW